MLRFEVIGARFVVLRGPDGQPLLATSMLPSETVCAQTVAAIRLCSPFEDRYERRRARYGGYYFVLEAIDGVALATSVIHDSHDERERAIELLLAHASDAPVLNLRAGATSSPESAVVLERPARTPRNGPVAGS